MKLSNGLALSALLATTAQACTRILVNEVWQDKTKRTRDITLWDQDRVSNLHVPYLHSRSDGDYWQGDGYTVMIDWDTAWGFVWYPGLENNGILKQQARKEFVNGDGKTQVYYCMWDNYDCGNYLCGLP